MRLADLRPALALCFILTVAVPAAGITSFSTSEEENVLLSGSNNPQALTIADVNSDNLGDIIVVEPDDDLMTVFINQGGGEIDVGDSYDTTGPGPVAVATGRFNSDNFIDIVTVDTVEGTISIFLNDEDGEAFFDDVDPRRFQVAPNPVGVAVGDFNGDTRDDLAVLSPDVIYLLQGNGDGTFNAFNPATISTRSSEAFAIKAARLNGDNILDLAITNRSTPTGQAALFLGTGTGAFNFNGFANAGRLPSGLAVADANGDLVNDLMIVDSEADLLSEILYLQNDGEGTFPMAETATGPEEPLAITTLDVEPDGKVDLAVTSQLDDEIFLLCQLSDKCTQPPFGGGIEAGIWRSAIGGTIPGCRMGGQVAIASGKLNDDTMDDLVALRGDLTTLCIMINTSVVGTVSPTPVNMTPTLTPTGPTSTPTVTPTPTNTATPTEVPTIGLRDCPVSEVDGVGLGQPVSVAIEDFDRDGTRDVAVADASGDRVLTILTTLGAPGDDVCSTFTRQLGATLTVTGPRSVVAADLDRNGSADIAVIGSTGLSVFYNNGQGAFTPSAANPITAGTTPSDIAVTDLNRDSTPDLIISDTGSSNVSIFLGTRQQANPFTGRCVMPVGRTTNKVVSTDLNIDGRSDFAVSGPQTLDIGVFLQMSSATLDCGDIAASFQGQTTLSLPQNRQPVGLVAGLFAQTDSVPDLVVAMTQTGGSGSVLLFEGRAAGTGVTYTTGSPVAVPTPKTGGQPSVPSALETGDIERDSRPDLILTDMANDSLAEFRGQSGGGVGAPLDALELRDAEDPVDLAVADIDGDDRDDVVVANAGGGGSISYLLSGLRNPTPTPTITDTPTATLSPTVAGTATFSPTITQTPTRSRRPSSTPTPLPTNTQRGVVTLSGNGCTIDETGGSAGFVLLMPLAVVLLLRRRVVGAPRS